MCAGESRGTKYEQIGCKLGYIYLFPTVIVPRPATAQTLPRLRKPLATGKEKYMKTQALDTKNLSDYLVQQIPGFKGPLTAEKFDGGQSNPTYKISSADGHPYVLRRKPPGELLKSAHAVDREFRVISALRDTEVPVPETYVLCEDDAVIGSMFYVMEYKEGRILWDPLLPEAADNAETPGCTAPKSSGTEAGVATRSASDSTNTLGLWEDVWNESLRGCTLCHSINPVSPRCSTDFECPPNGLVLTLDNYSGVVDGHNVVPFDLDRSVLWQRITTGDQATRMPLGLAPLTQAQLDIIRHWIEDGARFCPENQVCQ